MMTIYVNELRKRAKGVWCHLACADEHELHIFAVKLGLTLKDYKTSSPYPHYNIGNELRNLAIQAGAVEVAETRLYLLMGAGLIQTVLCCTHCTNSNIVVNHHSDNTFAVLCEACGASGPVCADYQQAIDMWNRRI